MSRGEDSLVHEERGGGNRNGGVLHYWRTMTQGGSPRDVKTGYIMRWPDHGRWLAARVEFHGLRPSSITAHQLRPRRKRTIYYHKTPTLSLKCVGNQYLSVFRVDRYTSQIKHNPGGPMLGRRCRRWHPPVGQRHFGQWANVGPTVACWATVALDAVIWVSPITP